MLHVPRARFVLAERGSLEQNLSVIAEIPTETDTSTTKKLSVIADMAQAMGPGGRGPSGPEPLARCGRSRPRCADAAPLPRPHSVFSRNGWRGAGARSNTCTGAPDRDAGSVRCRGGAQHPRESAGGAARMSLLLDLPSTGWRTSSFTGWLTPSFTGWLTPSFTGWLTPSGLSLSRKGERTESGAATANWATAGSVPRARGRRTGRLKYLAELQRLIDKRTAQERALGDSGRSGSPRSSFPARPTRRSAACGRQDVW